jgi:hypothetical protein
MVITDPTSEDTAGTRIDTGDIITTTDTGGKQGIPQDAGAYSAHPRTHRRGWMAGIRGLVGLLSVPGTALWRAVGSMTLPHPDDPLGRDAVTASPPLPGHAG